MATIWTQADLDRIDAAIASTELLVAFDSGKVRYRNMNELLKTRVLIWNTLQAARGKIIPCMKVCQVVPTSNL